MFNNPIDEVYPHKKSEDESKLEVDFNVMDSEEEDEDDEYEFKRRLIIKANSTKT